MRAKIRQLFCLIVIVIIALAIGAAAINVYMVWGTKGRILKKDQWANFKADGVVVLGCAVRPNKEASPMLNDRMQTAISFYKEASAKKMLVSGDNLNEDYDEVSVMKKLAVSGGIEADEVYMDHTGLNTYDTIVHSLEFFNPQLHHALGTLLCGGVEVGFGHDAVLTVVQLPVHHGVGEVPHIRVCRDGLHDGLILAQIGQLRFRVGSPDIPNCAAELLRKVCALDWRNGKVLPAVLRAFRGLPSQHHLRMVDEILIDGKAVRIRSRVSPDTRVYPIRFDFNGSVPLLKKDNIRNDLRAGVGLEGVIGQADRTK